MGTVTVMLVVVQFVAVAAAVPLNLTVLVPCGEPKFVPVIVTVAPTAPLVGDRLDMVGDEARAWPTRRRKNENRKKTACFQFLRRIGSSVLFPSHGSIPTTKTEGYVCLFAKEVILPSHSVPGLS